jgi:cell pole-organizing protein PopZ
MQQHGELSVEEILESIKKVIARDNRESALDERQRREAADVEELHAAGLGYGSDPSDEDEAADVLELGIGAAEMLEDDGQDAGQATATDSPAGETPLASDDTAQSARQALASLALMADFITPQQGAEGQGEAPLERMAREMLRPMLAAWLDTHLPPLVERMVRAEIQRITGLSR